MFGGQGALFSFTFPISIKTNHLRGAVPPRGILGGKRPDLQAAALLVPGLPREFQGGSVDNHVMEFT